MKIISKTGKDNIATVYLAEMRDNRIIEFLESVQPPFPRDKKWVLIVSTLYGCPVKCPICDAGGFYKGKLTKEEILNQIDFLVRQHYSDNSIPVTKFKIQFARMGEPSFNNAVLDVLDELPIRYKAPGLMPCLSTVAPNVSGKFFNRLLEIKRRNYFGRFQLQFSIHSTDQHERDYLIPVGKWSFKQIAEYGDRFFEEGDRQITLNFAPARDTSIDAEILRRHFDPDIFFIKITPLNPTYRARETGLSSLIDPDDEDKNHVLVERLQSQGFNVLFSIGETEENNIGSNCGQYITRHLREKNGDNMLKNCYKCRIEEYPKI